MVWDLDSNTKARKQMTEVEQSQSLMFWFTRKTTCVISKLGKTDNHFRTTSVGFCSRNINWKFILNKDKNTQIKHVYKQGYVTRTLEWLLMRWFEILVRIHKPGSKINYRFETEPKVNVFVCSQNKMNHFQTWENTQPSLNQKRLVLFAKY